MTDFDRERHEYWFNQACRSSRLIGGIDAYVKFATAETPLITMTAAEAIERIAQLLAEFDAETKKLRGGDK